MGRASSTVHVHDDPNPKAGTVHCPLCGGGLDPAPIETHGEHTLQGCSSCDLQFWLPMASPGPEWYQTCWLYGDEALRHAGFIRLRWGQRRFLADLPARGGTLLDVGCGAGAFVEAAGREGYHATGIDFSSEIVQIARSRFNLANVHLADFRTFADGASSRHAYDIVTAFEVLEHQDDIGMFMNCIVNVLRPRGFVALTVPNRDRWPKRWPHARWSWDCPPHHLTRWNPASLGTLCDRWSLSVRHLRREPVSRRWVGNFVKEALGISPLARWGFEWLEAYGCLQRNQPDAPVLLQPSALKMSAAVDVALLPLTIVVSQALRLTGYAGTCLYVLARLEGEPGRTSGGQGE